MPDLDTLLNDLNHDVPAMTDEAFARGRASLIAAMSSRRRFPVVVTAAASVLAIGAAFLVVGDDGTTEAAMDTPAELVEWARSLADDPPRLAPGQYLYERVQSTTDMNLVHPTLRVRVTGTVEQWIPFDYHDEWRRHISGTRVEFVRGTPEAAAAEGLTAPAPTEPVDRTAECGGYARPDAVNPCDGDGWGHTGSPAFYRGLTGDPQALYDTFVERTSGDESSEEIFSRAAHLLQPNVPNAFKATLFEAMSKIPTLTIHEDARTADGRTGIALRVAGENFTREQILDPETGDLIQADFITDDQRQETETFTYGVTDSPRTRPN